MYLRGREGGGREGDGDDVGQRGERWERGERGEREGRVRGDTSRFLDLIALTIVIPSLSHWNPPSIKPFSNMCLIQR